LLDASAFADPDPLVRADDLLFADAAPPPAIALEDACALALLEPAGYRII